MSAEKIGDIKEQLKSITDSQLAQFIEAYGSDERGGVIKLVDSAKKRLDKYEKELIRTEGLKKYEREYAGHPEAFQRLLVRSSRWCYPSFNLPKGRSLGFASTPSDYTPCSDSLSLRLQI